MNARQIAYRTGAVSLLRQARLDGPIAQIYYKTMDWYHRSHRHQKSRLAFHSQFIASGDLCFDVGANVGTRTALFLELGARVVCVEPQESCVNVLRSAYATNSNVIIVDKALGDRSGQGELLVSTHDHVLSTLSPHWSDEGRFASQHVWDMRQQVSIVTLDSLIAQYGMPRFCKIDVEGFELAVLRGLSHCIPVLSFEIVSEFRTEAQQCLDYLESLGPVVFNFSWGDSMKMMLPNWVGANVLLEKIGVAYDRALWGDVYAKFL